MLKYIILFSSMIFVFSACNRENIIGPIETQEEEIDPTMLESAPLEGFISDNMQQGLANSQVDLYQNGELLRSTITDIVGKFMFADIEYSDIPYRLYVIKSGFLSKMINFKTDQVQFDNIGVTMLSEDNLFEANGFSPLDTNIVEVSGQFVNNNIGVEGIVILNIGDSNEIMDYSVSDANGHFSLFVHQNTNVVLPYFSECFLLELNTMVSISVMTEDIVINPIEVSTPNVETVHFQGNVIHCEGLMLNGEIEVFTNNFNINYLGTIVVQNGQFDQNLPLCNSYQEYLLHFYEENSNILGGQVIVSSLELANIEIEACNNISTSNTMEVYVDHEPFFIIDHFAHIDSSGKLVVNSENFVNDNLLSLTVSNPTIGENEVDEFYIVTENYNSIPETENIQFFIETFTQEQVTGYFEGTFVGDNSSHNIQGYFALNLN